MTTTSTNGQKPVYNETGFNPTDPSNEKGKKWLTIIIYVIIGLALVAAYMYGKSNGRIEGVTETQQQYEAKEHKINAVNEEKDVLDNMEREKSKSSLERAKIIRNGVIRELPVIKDTPTVSKWYWLKDLANKKKN